MTGQTAFEKIVSSHLVQTLPDGRMVLRLDWVWGHEITTPNAILDMRERGIDRVFNPNQIKTMIDHVNPAKDTLSAIQGKIVRDWANEHGIEFLDVGRNGVCHAIIPEKGWIAPGQVGIMGDSHTCTHGAFNAFTAGVGTSEWEMGAITGLWICPPQKSIRVDFVGTLPDNVFSKDMILELIRQLGVKGATNAVIEFGGETIGILGMDARMTITNMVVEAGATSGIMPFDFTTRTYLKSSINNWSNIHHRAWSICNADEDAVYDQVITIDVSKLVPLTTQNYSLADVVPVEDLAGVSIDQVYIGSCTNGRISDLRIAAAILKGKKVDPNTRCIVVPTTQHIYEQALAEGLLEIFVRAGCFVSGPTCGACLGMSCGVLAPGEICVSTTNRNFHGRMGEGGMVHLASPATAAWSALMGCITYPTAIDSDFFRDAIRYTAAEEQDLTRKLGTTYVPPSYTELAQKVAVSNSVLDFSGNVLYLPLANVDTDQIIPARYLTETSKEELGKHCLEDVPMNTDERVDFRARLASASILVAGENFGCGSSREHAPWALEAAGIRCVIAPSFARIFENNMFANGLLCITLPQKTIEWLYHMKFDPIKIDLENGMLFENDAMRFSLTEHQLELIQQGGLAGVMLNLAAELEKAGKL